MQEPTAGDVGGDGPDPRSAAPVLTGAEEVLRNRVDRLAVAGRPEVLRGQGGARPGVAPGAYLRMPMVGYLEGIDSERGNHAADAQSRCRCGSSWSAGRC